MRKLRFAQTSREPAKNFVGHWGRSAYLVGWLGGLVLLLIGLVSVRHGLTGVGLDFRSAIWAPGKALLDGRDPYRPGVVQAVDPGVNPFPVYGAPQLGVATLAAIFPQSAAGHIFTVVVLAILLGTAVAVVRATGLPEIHWLTPALLGVLLLSRPGRTLVDLGQPTALYLPLAWVVWRCQSRPWVAGLALALLSGKPPFFLPVLVLLVVQQAWPTLLRGLGLAIAMGVPALAVLLSVSHGHLVSDVHRNTQQISAGDTSSRDQRIDLAALLHRAVGGNVTTVIAALLVLGLASLVVVLACRRLPSTDPFGATLSRGGLAFTALALATLLAVRHEDYDALLLVLPLAVLAVEARRVRTALIAGCALIPAVTSLLIPIDSVRRAVSLSYDDLESVSCALLFAGLLVIALLQVRQRATPVTPDAPTRGERSLIRALPADDRTA